MENKNIEKVKRFMLSTYDGDLYILEGYNSTDEITERLAGMEWATMPNGSKIRPSSISKIQSYDDYRFQKDAQWRHKRQQFLRLPNGEGRATWNDNQYGEINDADVKSISGVIKNLPQLQNKNTLTAPTKTR
jgi:hypothetical protein